MTGIDTAFVCGDEAETEMVGPELLISSSSGGPINGMFTLRGLVGLGDTTIVGIAAFTLGEAFKASSRSRSPGKLICGIIGAAFCAEPYWGTSSGVLIAGIDGTDEEAVETEGEGDRRREGGGASSRLKSIFAARRGACVENGYGFVGDPVRELALF